MKNLKKHKKKDSFSLYIKNYLPLLTFFTREIKGVSKRDATHPAKIQS
jgi:hypothetical protein